MENPNILTFYDNNKVVARLQFCGKYNPPIINSTNTSGSAVVGQTSSSTVSQQNIGENSQDGTSSVPKNNFPQVNNTASENGNVGKPITAVDGNGKNTPALLPSSNNISKD